MEPTDFEKLGVFYLGRRYDLDAGGAADEPLLYDSRDLLTHAVCVGMTGSGKTGLCLGLLEEAALDGIPAIAIDPKGDLGNLLLTFPDLSPAEFRPWIDEDAARRAGLTPDGFAAKQATLWRDGLAKWGEDGDRIRRLRASADFSIYTPGSTAGRPISILRSFDAPPAAVREDSELLGEKIETAVTGLLGLLGVDADPVRSREHVLLATVLQSAWSAGEGLDLAGLIQAIQTPPVQRIGVLDVDAFYPPKERFDLAMKVNALLAAPGFETWLEGEPLDVGALLHTAEGRPRVSIVSIAHLSEAERMFFVSLLLNEVVGWTRSQPGTTSLRAIVYMDEIFGFFPPVAEPPSKRPLLTLLKQARAFGVGVVLATQNPVDLDYKGLSNAGTWFIGRLQTERDKERVLAGLEGAAAGSEGFDRAAMEEVLAGLGQRIFLMNDVHEKGPVTFETRWAMSYLRGPLTRAEIKRLTPDAPAAAPAGGETPAAPPAASASSGGARPVLPPGVPETFVPFRGAAAGVVYEPALCGVADVRFEDRKSGADTTRSVVLRVPFGDGAAPVRWEQATDVEVDPGDLESAPAPGATFEPPPSAAVDPKAWAGWGRELVDHLYRTRTLALLRSPSLELVSEPGESERDFRIRLGQAARERRDEETGKLRARYAPKIAALQERIRKAEQAVQREADQAREHKVQAAISIGATLLGSVLGRKAISTRNLGRATTAARGLGRTMKQAGDVERARETLGDLREKLAEMDAEFRAETAALESRIDPLTETLETVEVRPHKKDIAVRLTALGWFPA